LHLRDTLAVPPAPEVVLAPLALALLTSSACSDALFCTDSTAERGRAEALVCTIVYAEMAWLLDDGTLIGEDWLAVEHFEQVADVLLIPNDRTEERVDCEADMKDGGGTHPPAPVESGDRLQRARRACRHVTGTTAALRCPGARSP
jgi:hypothetical protein